jgi:glycerophosphoryl diester phosphodiesterase
LEIAQTNFSGLLAARQAQSNPRSSHDRSGQGTPQLHCLEDVLAKYAESAFLDIELKTVGLEEAAIELLARFPAKRGAVVSSFLPEVLRRLAGLDTKLPLGLIFADREAMRQWELLPVSHLMPRHDLVDRRLVNEFHAAGKQVFAWTVNLERQMHSLAEMGVDGLISDDTELLGRFRESFIP